jgi:DNA polymerase-3 subunit delta
VIIKNWQADRFLERPQANVIAALFFGPDQGLVRERADVLARTVVPDLNDAFRLTDLDDAALAADNARLADEAAAISMFGGRRVVRVRGAGNALAPLFESFLRQPKGDALVVVQAGELNPSSALRKIFERSGNAAAVQCYPDSAQDLARVLQNALKLEGLTIASEALDDAVSRLGADRGITRREIEKLALYMRGQKRVELEDVRAILGDEAETRVDAVCDAAGEGAIGELDRELERIWQAGATATQILRSAMAHFQRLVQLKVILSQGEALDAKLKGSSKQRIASIERQTSRWSEKRLLDACDLLLETEALTRTTGVPVETVTGRTLFTIAAIARGSG